MMMTCRGLFVFALNPKPSPEKAQIVHVGKFRPLRSKRTWRRPCGSWHSERSWSQIQPTGALAFMEFRVSGFWVQDLEFGVLGLLGFRILRFRLWGLRFRILGSGARHGFH